MGDGLDTVNDEQGVDEIVFGEGITKAGVSVRHNVEDHLIQIRFLDESEVEIAGQGIDVVESLTSQSDYLIEGLRFFNDDLVMIREFLETNDSIMGTEGADELNGYAGDDVLLGGSGDDSIYGGEGADSLSGEEGEDSLYGDGGSDIYLYNLGDGIDYIIDSGGGNDELIIGAEIAPESTRIIYNNDNNDISIRFLDSSGIEIQDQAIYIALSLEYGPGGAFINSLETVRFSDGTTVELAEILANVDASEEADDLFGTSGNDSISSSGGADEIYSLAGDDTIDGEEEADYIESGIGNDTITGGIGDDTIYDEFGDDRYFYNSGDGFDQINDLNGLDTIIFGDGILSEHVRVAYYHESSLIEIRFRDQYGNDISDQGIDFYRQLNLEIENESEWFEFSSGEIMDLRAPPEINQFL